MCFSQKPRIPQELPLKSVGGREKVSLSLMCVMATNVLPFGLMAAFIAPTAVIPMLIKALVNYLVSFLSRVLQRSSWRCPLCRFAFQPHKFRTQNIVYSVVKEHRKGFYLPLYTLTFFLRERNMI